MLPSILLPWTLMLTAWILWLVRKKPYRAQREYRFRYCHFQVQVRRKWL